MARLTSLTAAAVAAGNGHVLDTSHVIFPNGAITLVLILAESHLCIHTWPEEDLIAIDLFSCGGIGGEAVISGLTRSLRLEETTVRALAASLEPVPRGSPGLTGLPSNRPFWNQPLTDRFRAASRTLTLVALRSLYVFEMTCDHVVSRSRCYS